MQTLAAPVITSILFLMVFSVAIGNRSPLSGGVDFVTFLISANFCAVKSINDGSFFFPLLGTGARKGLSVSIKILSFGKNLKVFCKSWVFLNVIIPLAEK